MAGTTLGLAPTTTAAPRRTLHAPTASTRTRRTHGALTLGGQLASVYSARRAGACYGITVEIGSGALQLSTSLTPAQARALASALTQAAACFEQQQSGRQS